MLDKILERLDNIDDRINEVEKKLDGVNNRIDALEKKFDNRMEAMKSTIMQKADNKIIENLTKRINCLEEFKQNYENALVMQESYNKRLNILIHGIKEDSNNPWEKRDETTDKLKKFLVDGLKIDDPDEVEFVDIHCLPQHPVKKEGKTVHRPIIVKLLMRADKNIVFKS